MTQELMTNCQLYSGNLVKTRIILKKNSQYRGFCCSSSVYLPLGPKRIFALSVMLSLAKIASPIVNFQKFVCSV